MKRTTQRNKMTANRKRISARPETTPKIEQIKTVRGWTDAEMVDRLVDKELALIAKEQSTASVQSK